MPLELTSTFSVIDPRFRKLALPYVHAEKLYTGCRWAEGPAWFAAGRYLVWSEVSALSAAGMEIGSHGERHLRLSALSGRELREEVVLSRMAIEAHLHRPVEVFAYPFNSSRARLRSAVRDAGYRAAVSGPAHGSADRFELFRSGVYARTTVEEVLREATR